MRRSLGQKKKTRTQQQHRNAYNILNDNMMRSLIHTKKKHMHKTMHTYAQ